MDSRLVYAKTPAGDEAVRQSTRVVQRNLRMVLLQVDGKLSVAELAAKIGNPRLVETALRELEGGGFIVPQQQLSSFPGAMERLEPKAEQVSALSQFSTFGPRSRAMSEVWGADSSAASNFSVFEPPSRPGVAGQATPAARDGAGEKAPPRARRGFPLRYVGWGGLGLLLVLALLVLIYPYQRFKPDLEAAAGRLLQAPVRIAEVGVAFWPRPVLKLSGIRIGEAADSQIEQLRIASPLSLLGSRPRVLSKLEVVGASFDADRLAGLPLFRIGEAGPAVQRMRVERLTITARDLALRELSGDLLFRRDGGLEKASLENAERSVRLEVASAPQGLQFSMEGYAWKPFGGALVFDAMQAKGVLQKGKLLIHSLDTSALGGVLRGSWLLDWRTGLVMAGEGTLGRMDCRRLGAVFAPAMKLDGELSGALRLRSAGPDWAGLLANVEAALDADISRGVFHGLDLGEVVRRGAGQEVRGGSTKFDRLRASVTITPHQVVGRDVLMSAGMVGASGQFVAAAERPVDGSLVVTMQTSVASMRTPVRVGGPLSSLVAISSR